MKFLNYINYILVRLFCRGLRVHADGADGSLTVNPSLYRALSICGINYRNKIFCFRIGDTFGFSCCMSADTDWCTLERSKDGEVGFVPSCPTLAQMLNDRRLPWDYESTLPVTAGITHGLVYFKLNFG